MLVKKKWQLKASKILISLFLSQAVMSKTMPSAHQTSHVKKNCEANCKNEITASLVSLQRPFLLPIPAPTVAPLNHFPAIVVGMDSFVGWPVSSRHRIQPHCFKCFLSKKKLVSLIVFNVLFKKNVLVSCNLRNGTRTPPGGGGPKSQSHQKNKRGAHIVTVTSNKSKNDAPSFTIIL